MVGIKNEVAGYIFDCDLKTHHERRLTITAKPVEEGSSITDHAQVEPKSVSLEIGVSDTVEDGQFAHRATRSISAYDVLCQLQDERQPVTITTKLAKYENMLLENITTSDDYTTKNKLIATVFFREIHIVGTDTVTLPDRTSAAPHKTGNTNKGAVQPQPQASESNRSALQKGFTGLRGVS
jgi:hypothetical protein